MNSFLNCSSTRTAANSQANSICPIFRDQTLDGDSVVTDRLLSPSGGSIGLSDISKSDCSATVRTSTSFHATHSRNSIYSSGYVSDDEASDFDEPSDSGRTTRSSARRANQPAANQDKQASRASDNNINKQAPTEASSTGAKGRKRKRKGSDGEGSGNESGDNVKSHCATNVKNSSSEPVCLCPRNVMKCIGILPSLPIVNNFIDSDDTHSSLNDDLAYTVLPTVSRNPKGTGGGEGE